jgi:aryl-alcohol dehydrogenase-like predicted oxidoreductase
MDDVKWERSGHSIVRRDFLALGLGMAAATVTPSFLFGAQSPSTAAAALGRRKLGALEVSALGLGCMSMSGTYNLPPDRQQMVTLIRSAFDRGVTFFDVAEVYGPFLSEEIVGEAIEPLKGKVQIATKFGFAGLENVPGPGQPMTAGRRRDSRPETIRRAVDGSLKRLRIDTIDLLYQHRADPNVPVEDVAGAVKALVQAGKARHFGLSEMSPATIRRAHAVLPVAAVQTEYSLLERVVESDVLRTCEELGIGFVPWGPTGRGFLTGRFDEKSTFERYDRRSSVAAFTPEALKANMPLLTLVREWAKKKGVTPVQFALGWLLAQKPWVVPIPGTTNPRHLEENLGAVNVKLTPAELQEIRASLSRITLVGVRKPESALVDQ